MTDVNAATHPAVARVVILEGDLLFSFCLGSKQNKAVRNRSEIFFAFSAQKSHVKPWNQLGLSKKRR
jgi:hypothetical protein